MKKLFTLVFLSVLIVLVGCSSDNSSTNNVPTIPSTTDIETQSQAEEPSTPELDEVKYMYVTVNNQSLEIKLENNSSAEAVLEKLKDGDVIMAMHDYGSFEKVGSLGFSLPKNDTNITTIPGDVILYQGNQITIYYDENTWNFTKLGHIDISQDELKAVLGDGDVEVDFSLENKR